MNIFETKLHEISYTGENAFERIMREAGEPKITDFEQPKPGEFRLFVNGRLKDPEKVMRLLKQEYRGWNVHWYWDEWNPGQKDVIVIEKAKVKSSLGNKEIKKLEI